MTALLASVRSAEEALDAANAGADVIDLKEPSAGALGGVDIGEIKRIVQMLRVRHAHKPVTATIGDLPNHALDTMTERIHDVAATRVDYVKVGVEPGAGAVRCLQHLASLRAPVVPVLLSDEGIDHEVVSIALQLGFAAIVFDTANKNGRTLFDHVDVVTLSACIEDARAHGTMIALAGSLGLNDIRRIRALAPDIAGFRGALCNAGEGRAGRLDPERVAMLADELHAITLSRRSTSSLLNTSTT
jgi:(5-formylfuran-3-yl)methyl phosphate synthase